jgi:hypothetical protein
VPFRNVPFPLHRSRRKRHSDNFRGHVGRDRLDSCHIVIVKTASAHGRSHHFFPKMDGRKVCCANDSAKRMLPRTRANRSSAMTAIESYAAGIPSETAGRRGAPKDLFEFHDFDRGRSLGCNEAGTSGHFSRRLARSRVITAWRNYCRNRPLLTMAYATLMIAGICAAGAEERQVATAIGPIGFHIPAQPLANALQAYGQRTGVQVLYESNSAVGRTSGAVEGNFTPDAALNLLLTGTDLRVRYLRADAITLAPPSVDGDRPPSAPFATADLSLGTLRTRGSSDSDGAARLHDYSESVQADIQEALRKNAKTRAGNYRAVLDIWIDPSRTIQRTELFRSTGDHERDTAVTTVLSGLTISRPAPANMPQPVRVVVLVKSLQ